MRQMKHSEERKRDVQERANRWVSRGAALLVSVTPHAAAAMSPGEAAREEVQRAVQRGEGVVRFGERAGALWRVERLGELWLFRGEGEGAFWSASRCAASGCEGVVFSLGGRVGVSEEARVHGEELELVGVEMEGASGRVKVKRAVFARGGWQRFEGLKSESRKERR